MEYDERNIESLLPRYCEGMATPEECRCVKEWMAGSEENRRVVKQMEMLYLAADTVHAMNKVDTEKALANVRRRAVGKKKLAWLGWMQRAAAILFIPLLAAYLLERYGSKEAGVQMLEVKTNPGMTAFVVLPDSTKVYLNSESVLRYPSSFDKGKCRNVEMAGEAYFEVTKDTEKRFVVSTPHYSQVEVLGTCFNVEAYDDSPDVSTTLIEGKVNFSFLDGATRRQVVLNPGQKVVYNSENGMTQLFKTTGETEISWKDGQIIFNNTPLKDALHILEKRYNVVFRQTNPALKAAFTGTFSSQRLERILEYFKLSSNIRWRYVDGEDALQKKTHIEIY